MPEAKHPAPQIEFYRPSEVATMLQLATQTVVGYCRKGIIPSIHVPDADSLTRIPKQEFHAWLEGHRHQEVK
ncbi:helix-turn-helix domain-containing protein [Granulicella tundricola]|uniref:Helix-turn-helix domain-containing protein n=1 Tax=Granulicella tundricola (strain ATCC BAA-1859 / DSM 23138 / MP5ACTX9) TaxID=1198114 RepID=E8X0P1_GRATM|nr:helix-turn-helix domain-containing protein [Granulicella tundricola]ADW68992.1 hypothetical protein AciX9_1946 [Granulicella tundricola MP5ACTX9]